MPTPDRTPLAVAVAQFAPTADDVGNLAEVARLAREAARRGARLVVFPEYSSAFVDPFDESFAALAQPLDGRFVTGLVALAGELDVHLVAGVVETGDGARVRNTVVAVDGGGVVAVARKLHLYDAFGQRESDWVEAGSVAAPETFEVDGIRIGMMTCYDLRFPEVSRLLADAGAEIVVVPSEWVRGALKEHHWSTLLAARAIENTLWVVAADHPPPLGVGLSAVVDPRGVTVAALGTETAVAVAVVDPDVIAQVRRTNPALALRRFRVVPREDPGGSLSDRATGR